MTGSSGGAPLEPRTETRDPAPEVVEAGLLQGAADPLGGEDRAQLVLLDQDGDQLRRTDPVTAVGRAGFRTEELGGDEELLGVEVRRELEEGEAEGAAVAAPPGDEELHVLEQAGAVAEPGEVVGGRELLPPP